MKLTNKLRLTFITVVILLISGSGCNKFVDIPLPVDSIAANGAYITDSSISGVVTGILYNISNNTAFGAVQSNEGIGVRAGLYSDELLNLKISDPASIGFYQDNLTPPYVSQWSSLYKQVYNCNIAIEGIRNTNAALINKNQWLGETLFCRAFLYFYLVNLFGDVPLTTSSDYTVNNVLARSPKAAVYQQMIADLKDAQGLLTTKFLDGYSAVAATRGRPNQSAVSALLARVYLYTGDYANAEVQATKVIADVTDFQMVAPTQAFLANSKETIFALAPTGANYVRDFGVFNNGITSVVTNSTVLAASVVASMSQSLLNAFEPGDTRFANWVKVVTTTTPAATYYLVNKYKSAVNGIEYLIVLRLAEQYLIRAEARAQQGNISGAQADLNAVRARAGLPNTTAATQTTLLAAIAKERQTELFTEFGHRFFDLKRTGAIDAVMTLAAPAKGGTWSSPKDLIWPIPPNDILADPNLTQSLGY